MDEQIQQKTCTGCGETYPATTEWFCRHKRGKYGLDSRCKPCKHKYDAQYHKEHREERRGERREYFARYREEHRDERREYTSRYNKEYPEKARVRSHRRRARKRLLPDDFTAEDWGYALEYWHGCCAVCGRQLTNLFGAHGAAADHWIPISDPRQDNPGSVPVNIIPLCHGEGGCNNIKKNRDPDEWLVERLGKRAAKKKKAEISAFFSTVRPT